MKITEAEFGVLEIALRQQRRTFQHNVESAHRQVALGKKSQEEGIRLVAFLGDQQARLEAARQWIKEKRRQEHGEKE